MPRSLLYLHEAECDFRPRPCPGRKCSDRLPPNKEMLEHLRTQHPHIMHGGKASSASLSYRMTTDSRGIGSEWNFINGGLVEFDGQTFHACACRNHGELRAWVLLVGPPSKGPDYRVWIEARNPSSSRGARLSYEGPLNTLDALDCLSRESPVGLAGLVVPTGVIPGLLSKGRNGEDVVALNFKLSRLPDFESQSMQVERE